MFCWTAEPMTAQGPRKGEPSYRFMRYGFRTQPAHLVRGSSRRIMTMRFRPANIRVINRRVCSWAVVGPAVQNKKRSKPTSGNVFPLCPSTRDVGARTVLAVKGSLRRAKHRRALDGCAPFRPGSRRDGRLRREHFAALHTSKNNRPASLLRRKAGLKTRTKPLRPEKGLTGRSISEADLRTQLQTAPAARSGDVTIVGILDTSVRVVELRSVGHPERLTADFHFHLLREVEDLEDG